ncbi:MAG TPA: DUF2975 domain-containing protein [Chloroflexota bacterium]|nr:DUF2975 domain-containing protein [Chloroflexota bacterium]
MKHDETRRLRAASRHFAVVAMVMMVLLLVFVGAMLIEEGRDPTSARLEIFVLRTVFLLPALFYLWALLALWRTFQDIGSGATFEPAIARGLRQLGWALLGSGVASAFVVPLIAITILRPTLGNGTPVPGHSGGAIDAAYLMLALVGVAILLLARLFRMAAEYRARKDELEAELSEFL